MHGSRADLRCSTATPQPAALCGWDIGGAHLKAVGLTASGDFLWACQAATPLWQGLAILQAALGQVAALLAPQAAHVLTLTGEAADCFPDRASGVHTLIGLWQGEFPSARAWVHAGGDRPLPLAGLSPDDLTGCAARNFLATASLCARLGLCGVLADMGSSTTDFVIVHPEGVRAVALDDAGRLASGELVYQGLTRTPVTALGLRAPFDGRWQSLMNERYATTADLHRLLGQLDEAADLHPTADGGEKTLRGSARRLARMVGRDLGDAPLEAWQQLAGWFAWRQRLLLVEALSLLCSRQPQALGQGLIVTGAGSGVLRSMARDLGVPAQGFATQVGVTGALDWVDRCAPAYACARLLALALADGHR